MPGLGKPTVGSQYTTNGMIVSTNGPTIDADISGFSWGVNINGATAAASIGGDTTGQQLGNVQFVLGASEMVAGEVLPFAITGDPSVEVLFRAINPLPSTIVVDDYASGKSPADYVLATPSQKVATDGSGRVTVDSKTGYALTSAYDPAKTAAQAGNAMTLTGAYDAAKTAAQAGDQMTLTSGALSAVAAAVWAVATSTLTASGTIGKLLVDNVNATVSGVAAAVWAYGTRILTAGTNIVLAKNTGLTGLNDLDAAGVRAAVGLASANIDTQFSAIAASASSSASSASAAAGSAASVDGKLTTARAGYLDNLSVGGAVASQADINALNQSASRRVTLSTVPQFERPESGSTSYMLEMRTYDGDGAPANADSTPSISPIGITSGSLSAFIGTVSNPTTGVYRASYSVAASATSEQIRFDASAVISGAYFPQAAFSQVVDQVSANFNTTDRTNLTAIANKLPSKSYIAGTDNASGAIEASAATGNFPGSVGSVVGSVTVGTNSDKTGYALTAGYDPAKTAAQAGDAMTLTSGERTSVAAAVWNALTSGMATVGSIGKKLADWVVGTIDTYTGNTKQTGDAYARMGAPAGASIAADVAAVKSDTGSIKTQTDKIGTSGGDSANTVTMQTRVDVAVSTRLAGSSYTAPDNTTVGTINTKLGTPASSVSADIAAVKTDSASLLAKLGAFTGSGINTVLGFLKALAGKTASAPSDMGGTFDPASDSLEAIADANEAFTTTGVILTSDAFDNIASPDPTSAPTTTTEKLALLLQTPLVIERAPTSGNGVISFVGSGGTTLFTRAVTNSDGNQALGASVWS
jgi:hypothetical protein